MTLDRFTSAGPTLRGPRNTERYHQPATGGGGSVDTIARAAAALAQSNITPIVPSPGKIIIPGDRVYTSFGVFENATAGDITLGATDPATEASLLLDDMTEVVEDQETGTNLDLSAADFADDEVPVLAEVVTGYNAQLVALGITAHTDDLLTYTSPQGKSFTWATGDADGAPLTLISSFDPEASGGFRAVQVAAIQALTPDTNPRVLVSYELLVETTTNPDAAEPTRAGVAYPVPAPTRATDAIEIIKYSAAEAYLVELDLWVNNVTTGQNKITLTANAAVDGWLVGI